MRFQGQRVSTNLFKRTLASGQIRWIIQYRSPKTGKWRQITGGRTKREASIFENRIREQLFNGKDPAERSRPRHLDLGVVIDSFYRSPRFLGGRALWQKETRRRIEGWIKPRWSKVEITELRKSDGMALYVDMKSKGLNRPSITKMHTALCLIPDHAEDLMEGFRNPFRGMREFARQYPKTAPEREINFLTPQELERVYKMCKGSKNSLLLPFVQFLANTGLRRGEALALRWKDIDFEDGFVHVRKSKNGQARKIPIEPDAKAALVDFLPAMNDGDSYWFKRFA